MADQQDIDARAWAAVTAIAHTSGFGAYRTSFYPKRVKTPMLVLQSVLGVLLLPLFGIGLIFIVGVALSPNFNRKRAAKRLHFFEHGLIIADANGPTSTHRWANLIVLQQITRTHVNGIYVGTTYLYTLIGADGTKTKVTQFFDRPEEWGPAIQEEITRAQVPGTLAALRAGANLAFGPLNINSGGVSTSARAMRWDEVEEVTVANGFLQLKRAGAWIRSAKPVSQIPNFFVLLNVAAVLRQEYAARFQPRA